MFSFLRELETTLELIAPDHLACYYYGHNNEDPEYIQKITMQAIRNIKNKALFPTKVGK